MSESEAALIGLFLFVLYIFPSILAMIRNVKHCGALTVINLLLGWAGIAWVITLAWACSDSTRKE